MPKKSISNIIFVFLFFVFLFFILYIYKQKNEIHLSVSTPITSSISNSENNNVLGNIYSPPHKIPYDERYFQFRQIGILTRKKTDSEHLILPLMGKMCCNNRNKWRYYTISTHGNLNTKLPITFKKRKCDCDYGCDELYNDDIVYVEGYKEYFSVTIYE